MSALSTHLPHSLASSFVHWPSFSYKGNVWLAWEWLEEWHALFVEHATSPTQLCLWDATLTSSRSMTSCHLERVICHALHMVRAIGSLGWLRSAFMVALVLAWRLAYQSSTCLMVLLPQVVCLGQLGWVTKGTTMARLLAI